jgi:signal peptidase I
MEPNFSDSDILYLNKKTKEYNHGDVVLMEFPDNKQIAIKRIIGLPGESV